MARKFTRKRWRRPQRLRLDETPVVRRKDMAVLTILPIGPQEAWPENRRRIIGLLVLFLAVCALEGAAVAATPLAWWTGLFPPVFGLLYLAGGARWGDAWIQRALGAAGHDSPQLLGQIKALAARISMDVPDLLVAPGETPNAFGFGLRRKWIVTTAGASSLGLLEAEAMLAHEIVHLRDGDATVSSVYVLLAGAADVVVKAMGAPAGVVALLSIPVWPACLVVRVLGARAFPRDREHRADVAAALLTRYPPAVGKLLSGVPREQAGSPLGATDRFWLAPRAAGPGMTVDERTAAIGEM
ncbi:MAG TPA: M48 family metalloprotease [Actinomycetota bacterium]|nr:M48 family metalloprotease [Actinomycetota bacterium]